jgi:two-component system, sporulation sensor kinase C
MPLQAPTACVLDPGVEQPMPFALYASSPESPTTLKVSTWVSRGLAGVMVLSGVLALLGWGAGLPALAAPFEGWRPMGPLSALVTIILGTAFWQRIHGRRRTAFAGAALGLLLVLPSLVTAGQIAGLLAIPLSSSVLFATAASGLLSGLLHRRPDLEKMILSLTGIGLIALAGTIAFANTLGMFGADPLGPMPGSALQVVTTTGLLGFCFLFLVWWSGFSEFEPPRWLPAASGLLGLATVMMFWTTLKAREEFRLGESTREAAFTEQRLLQRELASVTRALIRTAEWLEIDAEPVLLERVFLALLRDIPSVEAVFHLGARGIPVAQAPVPADFEDVAAEWQRLAPRDSLASDSLIFRPLDPNQERFLVFAPVCLEGCRGAVAAVVQAAVLFGPSLAETSGAFHFAISGPNGPLESSRAARHQPIDPSAPRMFGIGPLQWSLVAWPASPDLRPGRDLPAAVLFLGLAVTILFPLTLQLGLSAWQGAQERERSRLSYALDRATDGVWEVHLPTGHTARSPALWSNLGYAAAEVPTTQAGWLELIHPDDQPHVERAMSHHVAGDNESYEVEYRVRAADGDWHVLVERGRVVDWSSLGEPSRLVGITADVTEARAAEALRGEMERRYRAVFNSSFQFQVLMDNSCRVLEANPVTLTLSGFEAAAVRGKEVWETLWWAGQPDGQQRLREACDAARGGAAQSWEQEIHVPGRPPTILELSVRAIEDTEGAAAQLLLEGRDVTDRRRAEASLKEVETLTTMGRMAARVAHEINNPLAGIQSAFLLIRDAVPAEHPHHSYVGAIEREIERISRVTRQLYETYRPEQDATGTASLDQVVSDAVAFLDQVNRARDVRIVADLGNVPATVPVPAAVLRQIVYNLAQNAIDASPPGGRVDIIATATPDSLTIVVRDQGLGVPEELRDHVFEPFFSTKTASLETSGMGLGLALLRQTVVASGGTIAVGRAPGGGAEFVITLPLDDLTRGGRNA